MSKIAFIFPGQGSQYVGMGKDFFENYKEASAVYEEAKMATGIDVAEICFEENERINQTEYTQIAMFTTEAAIMSVIKDMGVKADMCAGLSLGEYGALYAAGVLPLADLCKLVRARGMYMQNACPTGGAMTAVLGMDTEAVKKACDATEGRVSIANYNCPGQLVITGEELGVAEVSKVLVEGGAKRCIPLKVSGPFHSSMLQPAADNMKAELEKYDVADPKIPYYSNVNATKVTSKDGIKELLTSQVVSSVYWMQTIEKMIADGIDTFIEIGPGKSLTGFMGRINKEVKVFNVDKVADLEKLKAALLP